MGLLFFVASGCLIFGATWDRDGARRALNEARALREEITRSSSPIAREKYLLCTQRYRQVYVKDPHFSGVPDAIYEQAILFVEMGHKFGRKEDFSRAAKLFRFLISDYGGCSLCPEALLRLADLCSGPLQDPKGAEQAYNQLRTQYRYSTVAAKLKAMNLSREEPEPARPVVHSAPPSAVSSAIEPGGVAEVQNLRYWTTNDYTRVVIDMEGEASYQKTHLTDPDRIYFDISRARVIPDLVNRKFVVGDNFLQQIRVAQNRADVVRIVLDCTKVGEFSVFELHDPFRLVIDISSPRPRMANSYPSERSVNRREDGLAPDRGKQSQPGAQQSARIEPLSRPAAQAGQEDVTRGSTAPSVTRERKENPDVAVAPSTHARETPGVTAKPSEKPTVMSPASVAATREPAIIPKPAAPTQSGSRTLTRVLGLKISRIVLDPGHGGHDTGTIGRGGLVEKDLVLDIAKDLRRLLQEQLGAEVFLTREDDTFVSLEERTALANQDRADLFVSIHANSSSVRSISGVETYYLNFARTAAEREVAARENATTVRNIRDLESLVKKIAQADKSAESRELAAIIQKKLYLGVQKVSPAARNRGVRSAPFVVLIGANMPSVLAEVAFISNPRDESLLKKEDNRERLAKALFAGIEGYMKSLGRDIAQNRSQAN